MTNKIAGIAYQNSLGSGIELGAKELSPLNLLIS